MSVRPFILIALPQCAFEVYLGVSLLGVGGQFEVLSDGRVKKLLSQAGGYAGIHCQRQLGIHRSCWIAL